MNAVTDDMMMWFFRLIMLLAFSIVWWQLRTANTHLKKIDTVDEDLKILRRDTLISIRALKRYLRVVVQVMAQGAEGGLRSTDPLVMMLEQEMKRDDEEESRNNL
jgi:hypothetical protein